MKSENTCINHMECDFFSYSPKIDRSQCETVVIEDSPCSTPLISSTEKISDSEKIYSNPGSQRAMKRNIISSPDQDSMKGQQLCPKKINNSSGYKNRKRKVDCESFLNSFENDMSNKKLNYLHKESSFICSDDDDFEDEHSIKAQRVENNRSFHKSFNQPFTESSEIVSQSSQLSIQYPVQDLPPLKSFQEMSSNRGTPPSKEIPYRKELPCNREMAYKTDNMPYKKNTPSNSGMSYSREVPFSRDIHSNREVPFNRKIISKRGMLSKNTLPNRLPKSQETTFALQRLESSPIKYHEDQNHAWLQSKNRVPMHEKVIDYFLQLCLHIP